MKKMFLLSMVLLVAFFAFQGMASAETISGKVASIDTAGNKLSLSTSDPAGNPANLDILITGSTTYAGISSVDDLKEGQQVSVEVTKDEATGVNNAITVTLSQPAETAATSQPAEAKEPAAQ